MLLGGDLLRRRLFTTYGVQLSSTVHTPQLRSDGDCSSSEWYKGAMI